MNHEHDWQISVLLPVGWPDNRPIPMDAPTVTYCTGCGSVFNEAAQLDEEAERWHLVIEDDNGEPYLTGCDCEKGKDHYESA